MTFWHDSHFENDESEDGGRRNVQCDSVFGRNKQLQLQASTTNYVLTEVSTTNYVLLTTV
ncbi:unnamed protein product [Cyprideis torosa]|uniref:Uncharacterized protein n=1 Tax=Cyprideis torosa TaxID=163714 RepID=A0A7R8WHX9_9CRUS|nr:unnamed protein product [Cyprideis torosa]CAG0900000.1 unnamed protein product [Cyprideis torosa]